jgi:phytoene dehydrogenase-like protein
MIVVVVGAGINGLVAAHYLRRAGHTVTVLDRADRAGGACVSATATVDGLAQSYALGASVLGLMPDFIFRETGLADRLDTYVPSSAKRVYFPTAGASAWIYRDPARLDQEFRRGGARPAMRQGSERTRPEWWPSSSRVSAPQSRLMSTMPAPHSGTS